MRFSHREKRIRLITVSSIKVLQCELVGFLARKNYFFIPLNIIGMVIDGGAAFAFISGVSVESLPRQSVNDTTAQTYDAATMPSTQSCFTTNEEVHNKRRIKPEKHSLLFFKRSRRNSQQDTH